MQRPAVPSSHGWRPRVNCSQASKHTKLPEETDVALLPTLEEIFVFTEHPRPSRTRRGEKPACSVLGKDARLLWPRCYSIPSSCRVHASPLDSRRPGSAVCYNRACSRPTAPKYDDECTHGVLSRVKPTSLFVDIDRSDHRRGRVSFRGSARWEDGASVGRSTGQQNIQTGTYWYFVRDYLWRTVGLICAVLRRERCLPPDENEACFGINADRSWKSVEAPW